MKIIVLGANGLLGRYVYTYLLHEYPNYHIIPITRSQFEITMDTNYKSIDKLFDTVLDTTNIVVINCIGLIKPQVDKFGPLLSLTVNSVFPRLLSEYCEINELKLIHITTDCVFSGKIGGYIETDPHDVYDTYGRTKSLGEPENCTVIRTSIIGEEIENKRSLLEWVKSQSDKNLTIKGFDDHIWNGLTCLQLSQIIGEIIDRNLYWNGVRHIFSERVTKYQLLKDIRELFNLNLNIDKVNSGNPCNRSLASKYPTYNWEIPSLRIQINTLKQYHDILVK